MTVSVLVLGAGQGWHADELHRAARERGVELSFAAYERLHSEIGCDPTGATQLFAQCAGFGETVLKRRNLNDFTGVLTRTMPAGSMETITFRLAVLHERQATGGHIVNPPRSLELAIDKFATLAEVTRLGIPVPETIVVQSVGDAMTAFDQLSGDVIVKPLFGGEGRGVMRVRDRELAWTTFRTLFQLNAVLYVQRFVSPGGRDWRVLIIGEHTHLLRRVNANGFRTNVAAGATCQAVPMDAALDRMARQAADRLGLTFCSVDFLETETGDAVLVEVNAIPGWRGAQNALQDDLARQIIESVLPADSREIN